MSGIVVTGARGYIGGALAKVLAGQGNSLRLVSRSVPAAAARLHGATWCQVDLGHDQDWRDLLRGAEAVVLLAARTDLRAAEADPVGDDALNVEPVRAMVRAAAAAGTCPKVVFASAVTIVGPRHANPVSEQTPDHPVSVYDRHKLACEQLLAEATRAGVVRACSLRLSNVYGGGFSVNANRGILNVMMQRAANGEPLTLYGKGQYMRDFIHLDDVVAAFAAALKHDIGDGRHHVIATGVGHSLAEAYRLIADEALQATGRRVDILEIAEPADLHTIERRNFIGDAALFRRLTGWRPRVALRDGVRAFFQARLGCCALDPPVVP